MFKNATLFQISLPADADVNEQLQRNPFAPTGPTQEMSTGWVPPRAKHGQLAETITGQVIIKLMIETRSVPASALESAADKAIAAIEKETGRKPGKKETKDIKEEAKLTLLPRAFPKTHSVLGWIDTQAKTLLVDTTSTTQAELFASSLMVCIDGLQIQPFQTQIEPQSAMVEALTQEGARLGQFESAGSCELKSSDDSKTAVRYTHHAMPFDELQENFAQDVLPVSMALTWRHQCEFTLTSGLTLKKITSLQARPAGNKKEDADDFDADVVLATGILRDVMAELVSALGGLVVASPPPAEKSVEEYSPF